MADAVSQIGPGVFKITVGDRQEIVYVAGTASNRWASWNGSVFRSNDEDQRHTVRPAGAAGAGPQTLSAPMPATVIKVLVAPGAHVATGETVVLLEAMKMELPIRALGNGTVKAVHCREGDLVQADQELVELE